jgi:hypothetical protein
MDMLDMPVITPEFVRSVLDYNEKTGELRWKDRTQDMFKTGKHSATHSCATWNSRYAGKIAANRHVKGYLTVSLLHYPRLAHRLIWLIVHGQWPSNCIDHINGLRDDNRLINLREATGQENQQNRGKTKNNKSGHIGVYQDKYGWTSEITVDWKRIKLGRFGTFEDARDAYLIAKKKFHTFHPTPR